MSVTNYPIDKIVKVDIVKQAVVPSLEDFGLFCLMSENILAIPPATRYKIYADLNEVLVDFSDTSEEYYAARSFFQQSPEPIEFMIAVVDVLFGETYVEAIADALSKKKFYGLGITNLALATVDVVAIAEYVQTQLMVLFLQTYSADMLALTTTGLVGQLASLNRTIPCFYETTNLTTRHDLALAGMGFTQQPGTFNWANQQLIGIAATSASDSDIELGIAAGLNFYLQTGGINLTRVGTTTGDSSGIRYIDERTGIDWLQIAIQQEVFQALVSADKIPDTDSGYHTIAGAIQTVLTSAVSLGILADLPAPTISYPALINVPLAQRQARIAGIFKFTARLAGAVNYITISGTLTV